MSHSKEEWQLHMKLLLSIRWTSGRGFLDHPIGQWFTGALKVEEQKKGAKRYLSTLCCESRGVRANKGMALEEGQRFIQEPQFSREGALRMPWFCSNKIHASLCPTELQDHWFVLGWEVPGNLLQCKVVCTQSTSSIASPPSKASSAHTEFSISRALWNKMLDGGFHRNIYLSSGFPS